MARLQISKGKMSATIDTVGASLVQLSDGNFQFIEVNTRSGLYAGTVLAPWPNRIRDGKYSFQGIEYFVPINEVSRSNALHGLVAEVDWTVSSHAESFVILETILDQPKIYPGKLNLITEYRLNANQCSVSITAKNIGANSAPYGVSIHPYLIAGGGEKVDELALQLPCDKYLTVDDQRLLPLKVSDVFRSEFDFQKGKKIAQLPIDHAFRFASGADRKVTLKNSSGKGVALSFGAESNWIQIHTSDRDGGRDSRAALAIEPMTCPPDAFNTGIDLIILKSGDQHTFNCQIAAI